MELLLVKHYYLPAGSGLDPIQTIFQNRTVAKGSGTCNWTVPNVKYGGFVNSSPRENVAVWTLTFNSSYSLWLNGNESLGVGYANLTNKFWIESPANSNPLLLSPGQIVGVVAGSLAAILMGASAIVIMLRVTRNKREARRLEGEEAHVRDSFDSDFDEKAFDSVLDEKAKAAVPMGDDRH
jgi:hypothetical protein